MPSLKDFKILESLGKGSFASVYKVVRKSDNKVYALKRVKINKMSKKEISDALNEIRFLASIRQHNIVGFLEAFLENNETELCIVMEFCGCGDLAQKIERYKRRRQYIDEDVLWRYLIQCLKALTCLHSHNICHRDLKSANTFIAEDGSVKIGDMNVSKRVKNGHLQTQIGTPYYMSPEIWNNRPYDFSSDMWSLGCMMYELASLRPPFVADSFPALKRVVTAGRYLPLPGKYSESFKRVVAQMLRVSARERPTAEALLASADLAAKLQLDDLAQARAKAMDSDRMKLMETIKVPQNLRKLDLPKPCYPDVRPNSPSAWTVVEQAHQHKKAVKLAASALPETDENSVAETNRSDSSVSSRPAGRHGGRVRQGAAASDMAPPPPLPAAAAAIPSARYVPKVPSAVHAQAPGMYNRGNSRMPQPPPVAATADPTGAQNRPRPHRLF